MAMVEETMPSGSIKKDRQLVVKSGVRLQKPKLTKRNPKKFSIPKNMSTKDKKNLKRNLATLGEKKRIVITNGGESNVTNTGFQVDLSAISQGDTDQTRDGDQISIRSVEVNWTFAINDLSIGDSYNIMRIVIFQWFPDTVSDPPSITEVLSTATTYAISPYTHDKRFQFRILMDQKVALSRGGPSAFTGREYIKSGFRRKIQYTSATTDGTNKLYAIFVSDSSGVPHPVVVYNIKTNYQDN